jgi:hypothetical protein
MSAPGARLAAADKIKSRRGSVGRAVARALIVAAAGLALMPAVAAAHGPVAPVATSYLAKPTHVPRGLDAQVVDGYLRIWLRVPSSATVVVLDYRGAPYLRFTRAGVQVNERSEMYYLNQTPVAETPPASLARNTPPHWQTVSAGHDYEWHDGRLQALAAVALAPGESYVGRWSIPLLVNGRLSSISGGLWHAGAPSIAWFWPIVVLLACVLAAWRVRRRTLDIQLSRVLGAGTLIALAVAGIARELHGRPTVTPSEYGELAAILLFAAWGLFRVSFRRPGYFTYFVIAFIAFWEGVDLVTTLVNGFVLVALPAALVRGATVLCLAGGAGLALLVFRLAADADSKLPLRGRASEEQQREQLAEAP